MTTVQKLKSLGTLYPNGVFCYDTDNSNTQSLSSNDNEKLLSLDNMLASDDSSSSSSSNDEEDEGVPVTSVDAKPSRVVKKSRDLRYHQTIAFRPYQPFRVGGTIYRGKKKMKVAQQQQQLQ